MKIPAICNEHGDDVQWLSPCYRNGEEKIVSRRTPMETNHAAPTILLEDVKDYCVIFFQLLPIFLCTNWQKGIKTKQSGIPCVPPYGKGNST